MRDHFFSALRLFLLLAAILLGFKLYKWSGHIRIAADDRSMEPDYKTGSYRVDNSARRAGELTAGAAVAYHPTGNPDLTRAAWVIAREGQRVTIRERRFWVDGQAAEKHPNLGRLHLKEIRVPRGCVFLVSNVPDQDSLRYGPIPMRNILGRLK